MSATQPAPDLASYRDAVTELVTRGEPFGALESAIHEAADLTREQKAALWLFAFSLRDRSEQQVDARVHPAFVQ
jgi:hypothetical protein